MSRALNNLDEELSKGEIEMETVKQLIEKVEMKYAKVEELSNKIQEASDDVDDIETEVNSMDTLLDRVIETKSRAKSAVKKEEKVYDISSISPQIEYVHSDRESKYRESIHLPKLDIAKFSGEIEEYREFMDMFKVAIDKNKRLADVEKFMYLKSYLKGDAEELLNGLPRTDANYAYALQLLEENYGNTDVLVNNHVSKLINLESQNEKDGASLRVLYNRVNTHVRELESLGITAEMYSVFLVPIVLSKLSEEVRKMWTRKKQKRNR